MTLTSGLPGSIHGDLDGSVVGGHLGRVGEHGDCERETFPWGNQGRSLMPDTFAAPPVSHLHSAAIVPDFKHREGRGSFAQAAGLGIPGLRKRAPSPCPGFSPFCVTIFFDNLSV